MPRTTLGKTRQVKTNYKIGVDSVELPKDCIDHSIIDFVVFIGGHKNACNNTKIVNS